MKKINIYTVATLVFVGVLVLAFGFYHFNKNKGTGLATYANAVYGISFTYPEDYELTEHQVTEGRSGVIVTITEKGITIPENGEGPTAITVAMYDGTSATTESSLLSWIKTSPYSNFTLAQQTEPGVTTIAGQDGYLYTWDGLYQGTTVVTEHEGNIIMLSVTYDGQADLEKRGVFTDLVTSVNLVEPGTSGTAAESE